MQVIVWSVWHCILEVLAASHFFAARNGHVLTVISRHVSPTMGSAGSGGVNMLHHTCPPPGVLTWQDKVGSGRHGWL
jgi:hypothetical protein